MEFEIDRKTVGKNLKWLRNENNYTQEEVVRKLRNTISIRTYQNYEEGESLPKLDSLILLSRLFGVSIDCIINGAVTDSDRYQTWNEKFLQLSSLLQDKILIPTLFEEFDYCGVKVEAVFVSVDKEVGQYLKNMINSLENGALNNEDCYANIGYYYKFSPTLKNDRKIRSISELNLKNE